MSKQEIQLPESIELKQRPDIGVLSIFVALLCSDLVMSSMVILRHSGFTGIYLGLVLKIFCVSLLAYTCVLMIKQKDAYVIDGFAAIYLVGIIYALLISLNNTIEIRSFISHLFVPIYAVALYIVAYNSSISSGQVVRILKIISSIGLPICIVIIALLEFLYQAKIVSYHSFAIPFLLLLFSYFLASKNKIAILIVSLLIVLTGKRALMFSAFCTGIFCFYFMRDYSKIKTAIFTLMTILISSVLIVVFFSSIRGCVEQFVVLDSIAKRVSSFNIFSGTFDIVRFSSGRFNEIASLLKNMEWYQWVFGVGYGWSFDWDTLSRIRTSHYTHFTYLNYFVQYGLVCGGAILSKMIMVVFKDYKKGDTLNEEVVSNFLLFFIIASLLNALGSYTLASNGLFWFSLGLLANKKRGSEKW